MGALDGGGVMVENVENLILEQLRLIREDMRGVKAELVAMREDMDDLKVGQQSLQGVVMALGHYMNAIDHRVEGLEKKMGDPS